MKREPEQPLFLERRRYLRRRLLDAAHLLPLIGFAFWSLPALRSPSTPGRETAGGMIYLFAIWAGLILAALLLSRALGTGDNDGAPPPDEPEEPGG